jgi:cyclic beta-1,2-glucan synthetase
LQWETAAEAEIGGYKRSRLDSYLDWTPALALGLGLLVWFGRRSALPAALPILLLWAGSKLLSLWLNQPARGLRRDVPEKDERLLRSASLRTWRYFAEFSTEEHNWLVPDNVQEKPPAIAPRVSPTNLGLLLNARQVACEFGYLTIPEFAQQTTRTLATVAKLQRYRGHLLNWYDTRSLLPLAPAVVSAVDSGNLLASLWTLQQGCLDLLSRPVLQTSAADGFLDHVLVLVSVRAFSQKRFSAFRKEIKRQDWLQYLLNIAAADLDSDRPKSAQANPSRDAKWFLEESHSRLNEIRQTVRSYAPWLLPEFAPLWDDLALRSKSAPDLPALERLPNFIDTLTVRLRFVIQSAVGAPNPLLRGLEALLPEARSNAVHLIQDLRTIATKAGALADEMDFRFLLNQRKLLSVGFDVDSKQVHSACYDLLATESRTAVFAAIAKEDIRQESWFLLGRAHTLDQGRPVLLSWTGTMFEYLMPLLWMRTYPNTLLERSASAAIGSQQAYAENKRIPWGISESAYFRMDEAGNYQYYAFGIPNLALSKRDVNALVVSPYSTFLALHVCASDALENLHRMSREGWLGAYGFYEAVDFTPARHHSWRHRYEIVPCWMAHHQGMSLLSIANFLHDGVVQRWFHSEPRVQATELLLHEKPVAHRVRSRTSYRANAA